MSDTDVRRTVEAQNLHDEVRATTKPALINYVAAIFA
jgi:hypothetical protein